MRVNLFFTEWSRVRKVSPDGIIIITTVAGNGTWGYSGDGGPATNAQITVGNVAVDRAGNLFFGDGTRIRKVSGNGIITTVAGNRSEFAGRGLGPLAVDGAGNLFVVTRASNGGVFSSDIRKVSFEGTITIVAGNGGPGYSGDGGLASEAQLNSISSLAVDDAGNVYVADLWNNAVRILRPINGSL